MAYRGFLAPGAKMGIDAPLGVSDWHASKALSLTLWGSGAEPQPPTLLRAFWCEWNPFLNSGNTISNSACQTGKLQKRSLSLSLLGIWGGARATNAFESIWVWMQPILNSAYTTFNSAYQTGKRQRRSPSQLEGLGRSPSRQRFWEHSGVNGTHFWIPLTHLPTRRVRLASFEGLSLAIWGLHLGVNGTHFWIALTPCSTLLTPTAGLQPAAS